jgi:hypothetical protein
MARQSATIMYFVLVMLVFNAMQPADASEIRDLFQTLSRTAKKFKGQLLEFFYRFRTFFVGHTDSTHQHMTTRGCGFAVDDEPTIYNKQAQVFGKIKGGEDAIWHTW